MATTIDDFYNEVIASLGGNLVDVEMETKDIDLCFRKAKRVFKQQGHNSYRNVFFKLSTEDAVDGLFKLPPNLDTIVQVIPAGGGSGSLTGSGDDIFNQMVHEMVFGGQGIGGCRGCGGMGDMLMYEMQQQQAAQLQRRQSAGGISFNHDPIRNTLKILSPTKDKVVVLDAYFDLEDVEYMEIDWIVRWTIAEAKQILGTAYRKFGGIAAPMGETNLSGTEYISEAKEEKRELLEEIENYVDGSMDYGQIIIG